MASQHFHKERLAELMHREIGEIIAREVRDPRIPSIVTISRIVLGSDIRNATVYVSIYDEGKKDEEALIALNKAAPFIQRLLASRIVVKHFPKLYFKFDEGIGHTQHIHELLKEIQNDLG